jgi:hypothetical protein
MGMKKLVVDGVERRIASPEDLQRALELPGVHTSIPYARSSSQSMRK